MKMGGKAGRREDGKAGERVLSVHFEPKSNSSSRLPAFPPSCPLPVKTSRSRRLRNGLVGLALAGVAAAVGPSCSTPFDPPSLVNGLRVLAVEADRPYAVICTEEQIADGSCDPGSATVQLKMKYFDGRPDVEEREAIQITWISGCFNPQGDAYFNCYEPLGQLLQQVSEGEAEATDFALQGPGFDTFSVTFPADALTSREAPAFGPKLATAFVFFAACAGELRPVQDAGDTEAQSFPFGCFTRGGTRLGPEAFVPGYTVLYAYEDQRTNALPVVSAFVFDDEPLAEGTAADVEACPITPEERAKTGCAATDEFTECATFAVDVDVPEDVAETDPDSTCVDGEPLDEVVWVNYYAEAGEFDGAVRLINDADQGYQEEHGTVWVPPPDPGRYALWAVVRDSRGGSTTLQRFVDVK
jgi:hypothetical protein